MHVRPIHTCIPRPPFVRTPGDGYSSQVWVGRRRGELQEERKDKKFLAPPCLLPPSPAARASPLGWTKTKTTEKGEENFAHTPPVINHSEAPDHSWGGRDTFFAGRRPKGGRGGGGGGRRWEPGRNSFPKRANSVMFRWVVLLVARRRAEEAGGAADSGDLRNFSRGNTRGENDVAN